MVVGINLHTYIVLHTQALLNQIAFVQEVSMSVCVCVCLSGPRTIKKYSHEMKSE